MPDYTNPGTTNPANQSYPAAPPPAAPKAKTPQGLPAEVNAGHASQVKTLPVAIAETQPRSKDVHAGANRPGGLPINVNIR